MDEKMKDVLRCCASPSLLLVLLALLVSSYGRGGKHEATLFLTHTLVLSSLFLSLFDPRRRAEIQQAWGNGKGILLGGFFLYSFALSLISPYVFASFLVLVDLVVAFGITVTLSSYGRNILKRAAILEILFVMISLHAFISLVTVFYDDYGRVRGFFENPVHFSCYVSLGIGIGVYLLLYVDKEEEGFPLRDRLVYAFLLVDVVAVSFTMSRSGVLAAAPLLILFLWRKWGRRKCWNTRSPSSTRSR